MATTKRERQKAARREKMVRLEKEAKRRRTVRRGVIVAIVAVVVVGSAALLFSGTKTPTTTTTSTSSTTSTSTTTTLPAAVVARQKAANLVATRAGCPASTATRANTLTWATAPKMAITATQPYYAHVVTTAGTFVIQLAAKTAPISVNNFVFLAQHKYYDCVIFHRVIPGFVDQTGDPTGTGTGSPGYTIADELPKVGNPTYPLYSVAMANSGAAHTGGAQFFIVTGSAGETLSPNYSLFGQVVSGQSVVKQINTEGTAAGTPTVTERMISVTITSQP